MNVKQIRELAQIARENGLSAIEITEGESHVRICLLYTSRCV